MKTKVIANSQCAVILDFLKQHKRKIVEASDFMNWNCPFVWYSASARLSELKSLWLVEKVSTRKGEKMRPIYLYKITQDWLEYFIGKPIQIEIVDTRPWYKKLFNK